MLRQNNTYIFVTIWFVLLRNNVVAFVSSSSSLSSMKGVGRKRMVRQGSIGMQQVIRRVFLSSSSSSSSSLPSTVSSSENDIKNKESNAVDDGNDYGEYSYFVRVLHDAIHKNSTEASSALLMKINELRERDDDDDVDDVDDGDWNDEQKKIKNNLNELEPFLDELLALGPDAPLPAWSRLRFFGKFSKRARMASLRRTLDMTMQPGDVDPKKDNVDNQLRRRRRALIVLLRTLEQKQQKAEGGRDDSRRRRRRKIPAIIELERKVIASTKESATTTNDLKSRIPPGLETPDYEVVNKIGGNIEIRRYEPYSVCAVSMNNNNKRNNNSKSSKKKSTSQKLSSPELSGASAFGSLAGYLFGKNEESTVMKMTTPVQTSMTTTTTTTATTTTTSSSEDEENDDDDDDDDDDRDRIMEFVLPSKYWGGTEKLKLAPTPLKGSGVTLQERPIEERGVLIFGGYASKKESEKRKRQLLSNLNKKDCQWKPIIATNDDEVFGVTRSGSDNIGSGGSINEPMVRLAQYNDPFTVPWKRRNEVSVRVERR